MAIVVVFVLASLLRIIFFLLVYRNLDFHLLLIKLVVTLSIIHNVKFAIYALLPRMVLI
jgi:hypothetical protein